MKPLVKTVATTAVVLSALAGCASRSSGGSSTSAPGAGGGAASSSSSSPSQTPSTSSSNPGASNPTDGGTVKYVSPQGIALSKDGATLVTEVSWGGCNDQPQLVVTSQDASKVVVELKTVSHYKVGIMCPDFARNGQATVKLAAPLGSRQVIDGVKNVALSVGR